MLGANWRRTAVVGLGVAGSLLAAASPARAEWMTAVYLGHALTTPSNLRFGGDTLRHVEFDDSTTVGGRVGYWFEDGFFGLAVDLLYFTPDAGPQGVVSSTRGQIRFGSFDLSTVALAAEIALRAPLLASAEYPAGRLQPYLLIGPMLALTHAKDSTNFGPPNGQSQNRSSVGVSAGIGLAWQMTRQLGVFGEYHLTSFSANFRFNANGPKTETNFDLATHHLLVGVSYRFP